MVKTFADALMCDRPGHTSDDTYSDRFSPVSVAPAFGGLGVDAQQVSDNHGRKFGQGVHDGGVPSCAGGQTVVTQRAGEAGGYAGVQGFVPARGTYVQP